MSEFSREEIVAGKAFTRAVIAEMLMKNFEKLPVSDQKIFFYGPLLLGVNAGFTGMLFNKLFSGALHVTQARFASALPMTVLPFLTTSAMYAAAVSSQLVTGDLNCSSCATIRGALVGVFGGGVHPILMALPMNIGLACRFNTTPIPGIGHIIRYCVDLSRPFSGKIMGVMVLQAFVGALMGSKHFEIYTKLVQVTYGSSEEELGD